MNHTTEIAAPYLDAYCRASGMTWQTVLSWLPYVAAAKLANVRSELDGLIEIIELALIQLSPSICRVASRRLR